MSQRVSDFDFHLPEGQIATQPAQPRDGARLLYVPKQGINGHFHVRDLPAFLKEGDVVVVNNSKVIPARLFGQRGEAKLEFLLHKALPGGAWEAFAKPAKKLKAGDVIAFGEGFEARVLSLPIDGLVPLQFNDIGDAFHAKLQRFGHMPLPPYIRRDDVAADRSDYQTIYAAPEGSVAAPTAGLHFTPALMEALKNKGVGIVPLTLHVGAGTFLPVKVDKLDDHIMHAEVAEVSAEAAAAINEAKAKGGRVIAVGTTSTRTLESAADDNGLLREWRGDTRLFIRPGYTFKVVDVLMTNFHLPRSTLFMLVSAFAGTERMKAAYNEAIENNYRFYSYGDACLLEHA
jgi:S-adenosylmethionine:tRNA ribosyltransferase-isomerase